MNVIDLEMGKRYKYKDLCILLQVKEKGRGNSRNCQFKDWERYFKFHKQGQKIIIDEIFHVPKEKIDNRKGHSGKSKGSRNNNIYGKYVDFILAHYYFTNSREQVIYRTTNQLSEMVGLINKNYSAAFSNKNKFLEYSHRQINEEVNRTALDDFFSVVKSSIKGIIKSSLNRLAEKKIIDYEEVYILTFNYEIRAANEEETKIIKDIEKTVLENMNIEKKNKLQYNDKLKNMYYEEVTRLVTSEIQDVDGIFYGYRIDIKECVYEIEDISIFIKQLNKLFILKTEEKIKKIQHKYKFSDIGMLNSFLEKQVINRLDSSYTLYAKYLIKALLSYNYKDMTKEIKKEVTIEDIRKGNVDWNYLTNNEDLFAKVMDQLDDIDIPY